MKRKTINRAPYTGAPMGFVAAAAPVKPAAPTFSAQPTAYNLYQQGGKLEVLGADSADATAYQWQKQNGDGSWGDVPNRTGKTITVATADASFAGVYRLKAVNGTSDPAYSALAYVYDCFLFVQNDSSSDPAGPGVLPGSDKYHWIDDGPAGARYFSGFLRFTQDQALPDGTMIQAGTVISNANIAKIGFTTGRMVCAWATTNAAVAPATGVSATGQLPTNIKTGSAVLTATFRNLKSELAVTVP